jgi:regulation of enolase protein 1 (concanavalin A-like superfamily)
MVNSLRILRAWPALGLFWLFFHQIAHSQSFPANPYKAPLYWSVYEYHIMRERTGLPGSQNYIPESEFSAHVDMVEAKLKPFGYNMLCLDGWGDTTAVNAYGYRVSHSRHWAKDYAWWSAHLRSRGMKLGMYANPLWLHADNVSPSAKIVGTDIPILSLHDPADSWWVQIDRPGAEAYVKGYIKHFADMGIDYLRIDFLSWYETGTDRNIPGTVHGSRPGGNGSARYATALRWMREAADQHGVFLSLVMPHLFNEAATEQLYGHMIRVNEDKFAGGWSRWSEAERGVKRVGWSVYANAMDGLAYWSAIAGRGKMILDSDFIRLNTFVNDEERKTVISACLLAGGPVTPSDTIPTLGRHLWLYTNPEMLALNQDGFVGKPLTNDVTSVQSQIWTGQMSNGDWIVGLFNREDTPQTRTLSLAQLGLSSARVRDLWQHADLGTMATLSFEIPAHGCRVFRMVPGATSLPGPSALRLANLVVDTVAGPGGGVKARATWTVTDGFGTPVPGALLTANFGGSFREEWAGTSDPTGKVVLTTTASTAEAPALQVEVLHLAKPGYAYAPNLNAADTTQIGPRRYLGGTFTEWRLQDIPMQWKQGAWQAERIPLGSHLFPGMSNTYEMKFTDELYFLGNDWGGANGTTGTALSTTFGRGNNLVFTLATNGLYRFRLNPGTLAYAITPDWFSTDVGTVGTPGVATSPGEARYLLRGSGWDIEWTNDAFHFFWQPHQGDLDLQAKVSGLGATDPWAKAGLMFRSTTNAQSPHASLLVTPSNGVIFQSRPSPGASSGNTLQQGISPPVWLRLKKTGTTFQSLYSTNGTHWTSLQTTNINSIGTSFLVGLAACSHSDGTLTEAQFEEFYLRTNSANYAWSPASPARGQPATLTYFAEGRSLTNSTVVMARIRPNNGTEEIFPWPTMTRISPDIWTLTYPVPSGATNLAFSFVNSSGVTDTGATNPTAASSTTPPPAPANLSTLPVGPNPFPYVTDGSIKFSWSPVASPDGLAALYRVVVNQNDGTTTSLTPLTEITISGAIGDQISVSVQALHSLDFTQASSAGTASLTNTFLSPAADQDGDGMINSAEEIAGTNPMNPQSVFQVSQLQPGTGTMTLTWPSAPGKTYQIQWTENLSSASFSALQSAMVSASAGSTTSWTDPNPGSSRRFYKVIVIP